jgi:hypothetical protein
LLSARWRTPSLAEESGVPGLIVMSLSDDQGEIDRHRKRVVVLFNASTQEQAFTLAGLEGQTLALHPIQAASSDPVVRTARFDPESGTFSVPARTTAVFVASR